MQIGFDRYIASEWAIAAFKVKAGIANLEELELILSESHKGSAAKKKTQTVLNRLWLDPISNLSDFSERAIALQLDRKEVPIIALTWGMAIATYPFFGRVAEIVGKITALQGECYASEVHRRMAEVYGEREGTRRMTNMILQTQESWGGIKRVDMKRRIVRENPMLIEDQVLAMWLLESCLISDGKPISIAAARNVSKLYAFRIDENINISLGSHSISSINSSVSGSGFQFISLS